MSDTHTVSLWRRIRFTPVSDAMRGRLSGRLDVDRQLSEAALPAAITGLVRQVIRQTRLWRSEKADVAEELIAHFRDGLDDGVSAAELVADFDDTTQAAKLIRRAKKRNRPWLWHAMRSLGLGFCGLAVVYVLAGLLLLTGRPNVAVDYVAPLNERALAVPEEDRAWPIYRQALLAGLRDVDMSPVQVTRGTGIIRAGDPGWPEAESDRPVWERTTRTQLDEAIDSLDETFLQRMRYWYLSITAPALAASTQPRDTAVAQRDALLVAIALELYRRDHDDALPADLAALSPRYLPTPPVDHSTGGPLRVRYTEDGRFILYGLGRNGEDNGGTLSDDARRHLPNMPDDGDWVLHPPMITPPAHDADR
jgi:hypothetical protein